MKLRTITIEASAFNSLEGFYKYIEDFLKAGECPWGINLDSLDEIVQFNFNYTEDESKDVVIVTWKDFAKSKSEIKDVIGDRPIMEILEQIFESNPRLRFVK